MYALVSMVRYTAMTLICKNDENHVSRSYHSFTIRHGQLVSGLELTAFSDLEGLRTNWLRLNNLYTLQKQRIEGFLGEPETIAYLKDTNGEFVFHNVSRAEIMKRAFFSLRISRNEDLFSIENHRRYYLSPEEYDLFRL